MRATVDAATRWYVCGDGSEPVGPLSAELIERGIMAGKVPDDAVVCAEGGISWVPIASISSFAAALETASQREAWLVEADSEAAQRDRDRLAAEEVARQAAEAAERERVRAASFEAAQRERERLAAEEAATRAAEAKAVQRERERRHAEERARRASEEAQRERLAAEALARGKRREPPAPPKASFPIWYLAYRGVGPVGPLPESELRSEIRKGSIRGDAYLCVVGEPTWQPARRVATFADAWPRDDLGGSTAATQPPVPATKLTPKRSRVSRWILLGAGIVGMLLAGLLVVVWLTAAKERAEKNALASASYERCVGLEQKGDLESARQACMEAYFTGSDEAITKQAKAEADRISDKIAAKKAAEQRERSAARVRAAIDSVKSGTAPDTSSFTPSEQAAFKSALMELLESWRREFKGVRYWRMENADVACRFTGAGQIGYLLSGRDVKTRLAVASRFHCGSFPSGDTGGKRPVCCGDTDITLVLDEGVTP